MTGLDVPAWVSRPEELAGEKVLDVHGRRAMVSVPLLNAPSHVSAPEYAVVKLSLAMGDAVPVSVELHAGVGSSLPPAAKNILMVSVVPAIVPEKVPLLFR